MRLINEIKKAYSDMKLSKEDLLNLLAQNAFLEENLYEQKTILGERIVSLLKDHPELVSRFIKFDLDAKTRVQKVANIRRDLFCSIKDAVEILDKIPF